MACVSDMIEATHSLLAVNSDRGGTTTYYEKADGLRSCLEHLSDAPVKKRSVLIVEIMHSQFKSNTQSSWKKFLLVLLQTLGLSDKDVDIAMTKHRLKEEHLTAARTMVDQYERDNIQPTGPALRRAQERCRQIGARETKERVQKVSQVDPKREPSSKRRKVETHAEPSLEAAGTSASSAAGPPLHSSVWTQASSLAGSYHRANHELRGRLVRGSLVTLWTSDAEEAEHYRSALQGSYWGEVEIRVGEPFL